MMRAQRVREGESRVEMQIAKWTAEGAVNGGLWIGFLVFCDVRAYVICRGYVSILMSVRNDS